VAATLNGTRFSSPTSATPGSTSCLARPREKARCERFCGAVRFPGLRVGPVFKRWASTVHRRESSCSRRGGSAENRLGRGAGIAIAMRALDWAVGISGAGQASHRRGLISRGALQGAQPRASDDFLPRIWRPAPSRPACLPTMPLALRTRQTFHAQASMASPLHHTACSWRSMRCSRGEEGRHLRAISSGTFATQSAAVYEGSNQVQRIRHARHLLAKLPHGLSVTESRSRSGTPSGSSSRPSCSARG